MLNVLVAMFNKYASSYFIPSSLSSAPFCSRSTYERISARAQSELAFSRMKLVVDLEKTLYLLPSPILRICGFRFVPALKCQNGSCAPACVLR